jgi:uncharacterized protein YaaN involved in tellurite resistance
MAKELDTVSETTGLVTVSSTATTPAIATMVDAETLTPEEAQAVEVLAKEIRANFLDDKYMGTFGANAQTEVARFSREALGNTRVYETGLESQKLIGQFRNELAEFKRTEVPRGVSGLYARMIGAVKWWMRKYQRVTAFVDGAEQKFKKQITELTVDLNVNDKAHEINLRNRRALIVHIRAGKSALQWARTVRLVELQATANTTQARSDIEVASDFSKRCDEFELKLGRLDSSLAITYIRKPEIDLLRDSQRKSISLFEDLVNQAIPLWLDGMRISLNIKDLEQANELAVAARDMTEGLFLSNTERLGQAAEAAVKNVDSGLIRTAVIIEGTDKLLASLAAVDAACKEALANTRQYEKDRAANNARISEYQAGAMSRS